jgi:hypothetical protein
MSTEDQPKRDRSPGYSTEIAETIFHRLVEGESLRAICADPAMPARATVFRWLARHPEFRRSYAIARDCQMEDLMDEMLEIADDSSRDYVKKTGADGKVTRVFNKEHFEDRRRRINAHKWTLTHLAPKKYRYR